MSSAATAWADVRLVLRGPFRILAVERFLDSVGSGLTMSLLVVYLAEVRGLPILTATLVLPGCRATSASRTAWAVLLGSIGYM